MTDIMKELEHGLLKEKLPTFSVGDTVEVHVNIKEGDKNRVQKFVGTVIRYKGGGLRRTFTVRRLVQGEGVERIFPVHSPVVADVVVLRRGAVRRAKLYYLRDRVGKATRVRDLVGGESEETEVKEKKEHKRGKKAKAARAARREAAAAAVAQKVGEPTASPATAHASNAPAPAAAAAEAAGGEGAPAAASTPAPAPAGAGA
ncbi:MAG: 50S ribosomal protein L19 [Planctomycetes bacterium]|nr:50S ribosomal protein L19 [Planctomycetota bacterium]